MNIKEGEEKFFIISTIDLLRESIFLQADLFSQEDLDLYIKMLDDLHAKSTCNLKINFKFKFPSIECQ